MIGIVVVSHSPKLARAAVELALEMVGVAGPAIAIAAGAGEGVTGTDAFKVAEAIAEVSSPEGVLVMMDLGSAVMSAEMALEFLEDPDIPVRLSSAPFVEGLMAAVVRAAGGATLAEVEREARGALGAKQSHLGDEDPAGLTVDTGPAAEHTIEVTLLNPDGLHARPVSMLITALSTLEATVTVANLRTGQAPVPANSPTALLTVGARKGDTISVAAAGRQAVEALEAVSDLVGKGFGELGTVPARAPEPSPAQPQARPASGALSSGPLSSGPLSSGPLGVSPGLAVGPIVRMPEPLDEPGPVAELPVSEREAAADRIVAASASVALTLREKAARVSGAARGILDATALMAEDPGLIDAAVSRVTGQGDVPERAVWAAVGEVAAVFTQQGGLLAARIPDLNDVRNRIVSELLGRPAPGLPDRSEPYVLVARDLAPADTALIDPAVCRAIVTVEGGPTSHTAILARALGLPAVVAVRDALDLPEGSVVIVDGTTGEIVVDPTDDQMVRAEEQIGRVATFDGTGQTRDGHRVQLLANVASPDSVAEAIEAKAEGVGLFRTEFCFLDHAEAPGLDEQVAAYRQVFAAFPGRKVTIRTLDAGADKPLAFVTAADEVNPALGIRGYRTAWRRPELLDTQLQAIATAAAAEDAVVGVMAPMIATVDEAVDFAARCAAHGLHNVGVMIETPAAAITAGPILERVDFASLGTNDLAQYTMAADRLMGELALLNDPWQPAVLRMIREACQAGLAAEKPVGVCGEAAADPMLAAILVGLGATSLSMSPRALGGVAELLGAVTVDQCRDAAVAAADAGSTGAARSAAAALLEPARA
ncbi:phosphoenolpyruvate--protein phosphotransferase [Cryobacterium sinapicolor]|uniref:Phosphoenolpyruvate-protein phosphotransferase n=1 Tax=Cryobacterium sinapicolor TaxID=1259236 RepID=A0ABY2J7N4_9MICO|nr:MULTISPECIES: phosphoenolpyruvate--protein phosphotransferase [Cryobacterium]TFC86163.1 phosphoenolpyruvate--protein phosphotransferase [Cryobacterium sp. TMT3-29-2]TFD00959.1 phosphoenolpyruvate--protein phosphotransferase [Cryobacterium sinapicolor]